MDTKFLKIAYGLKGLEITNVEEVNGVIQIGIETKKGQYKCSECGSRNVIKKGSVDRYFKEVPVGLRAVVLKAKVQRLECKACGLIRQEELKIADKKKGIRII
jgi:transposase